MITIDNILTIEHKDKLKNIIDHEIKHNLCKDVPLYQSFNNMQERYKDDETIKYLGNKALKEAELASNRKLSISHLWFNVTKEDSNYGFHKHDHTDVTCVYFLENCENNGTIFQIGNSHLQLLCKDNTIIIFDPKLLHSIPNWNGKNRYSVAIDFTLQQ
jgi:hypothetical protein